jgi:hypothetical protein
MASTGFIFAAILAGIIPEITPKTIHKLRAIKIIFGAMEIGNGSTELNAKVNNQTKNNPTNPPTIHKKALSKRNSYNMVELFAPMAFFNPIWLVLSLTVTNMILATPNAPTNRDNPAIAHPPWFTEPKKPST